MKWLREKKNVRKAADQANAALDAASHGIRERWPQPIRIAYESLVMQDGATVPARCQKVTPPVDPHAVLLADKCKQLDKDAYRARMDAENTFDTAERQLSTSLAREGCRKAICCWELHEKAIRKAETLIASK